MSAGNGERYGFDGPREQVRQLERRADTNDREHDVINQTIGAINVNQAEQRRDVAAVKEDLTTFRESVAKEFDEQRQWREKWSGRQWMLMGFVIVFALGAVGNLLVLLSQRGSP